MRSRRRARASPTAPGCGVGASASVPASSFARRWRSSTGSARRRGRSAAGAELAATGETAHRREPWTLGELTPQELQIALLLADGKTTREAAAALFLSPKTIEYHLRSVYRKLDINSRGALAEALA